MMMRLHDLIAALQVQERQHGNIECQVWMEGPLIKEDLVGCRMVLTHTGLPEFDLIPDAEFGDSLGILFSPARGQCT